MQPKAVSLSRTDAISPQIKWLMMGMLALAFVLMQAVVALAKPESLAPLAEKISPSVVNITTSTTVEGRTGPRGIVPEGSPFEDFFKEFRDRNNGGEAPAPRKSSALGSGFVISEDGFVVTNNHVIEGADEITIEFFTGLELKAEVIGTDPNTDIALLKVEAPSALPFVSFGDSNAARVGDWVLAMGNPLGQGFSVSAGIVSARNRALSGTYDDYIQTDAAINRGVNTAILSPNGGSIGIGFSMASNVVTRVVNQLKEFGETRRGWLGVRIQDVTQDVADAMGLAKASGALITDVPDGPAKDAGLKTGDVILSFAGVEVEDTRGLVRQVGNSTVGASVRVTVLREGKSQTLKVKLGRREDAEGAGASASAPEDEAEPEAPASKSVLGLTITPLTDDLRTELGADDSVEGLAVTEVDEMSEAFEKGLRVGDIITEAEQQPILSITDLEDRITEAKDGGRKSLLLLVRRAGDPRFVALGLGD